ncbi:MAG: ABC transporter ATP-binding protein [Methanocella sp.]
MSDLTIKVQDLGKQYRIGGNSVPYLTLRDAVASALKVPFNRQKPGETADAPGYFWSLRDVSFEVRSGEVLGIIGRNGAGKSTLLKILSKITTPTTGRAELYGRVGSLLEVGTGFHQELTGRDNIFLSGAMLGMKRSEIQAKFDDIVKFAETEKFLDTPLKHYSSGMQVRLGFAVAAFLEPEILVIDEVLAVGDADFQKKCLGKIEDVSKAGRTVLFVSHNMDAVERLCTRVIRLDNGIMKQDTTDTRTAIHDYLYGNEEIKPYEWVNTNNLFDGHWIKLERFYLSTDNYAKQGIFTNDSNIRINLDIEIKNTEPGLNFGYAIYNEEGHLLYWSFQTDTAQAKWPPLKKGHATVTSTIPAQLLNEGIYRIEMIASIHFKEWIIQPGVNSPSIYLIIQGGLSESPLWMNKRPGILAPVVQWGISYDNNPRK